MAVTPLEWERQVAPEIHGVLPGTWQARGGYLSRVAADGHLLWHVSRQVTRGGGYSFHAVIQPLYIVTDVVDGTLGLDIGHGHAGIRSYFASETVADVPIDEIRSLLQRFAVPYLERHGKDLYSFLDLTTSFARHRPDRRGTWSTEAAAAGGYALLGDWTRSDRAWQSCLAELSQLPPDLEPELRQMATHALASNDVARRKAVVRRLADNERQMRRTWNLGQDH